ncbi:nuclear transport factor 2 family protein [Hugenholtzia roseola]|uniref:nuclear transport factor 2 family protein n=1 Tax=Hugenholtzia roseola TaxID=1002 RepID=UPI0004102A51|nr:nuclear transport factor 2 family protein [Hugenholtzia roseola]
MKLPTQIVTDFYTAFQNKDAEKMAALYHDEVVFNDPAFHNLKGEEARDMWRMLISRGKDMEMNFSGIKEVGEWDNGVEVIAHWEAIYTFTKTGRKVHNIINARFQVVEGKILRHTDDFNLWHWAGMALGFSGKILGWTPFVQNKIRKNARLALDLYRKNKS